MARCEHKISGICKECMKKDFNLSEKMEVKCVKCGTITYNICLTKDVKTFIQKLKEGLQYTAYVDERLELVDKLAGDEFK